MSISTRLLVLFAFCLALQVGCAKPDTTPAVGTPETSPTHVGGKKKVPEVPAVPP
jgi:hypothetical protein